MGSVVNELGADTTCHSLETGGVTVEGFARLGRRRQDRRLIALLSHLRWFLRHNICASGGDEGLGSSFYSRQRQA